MTALTHDRLIELFEYQPDTGLFLRKKQRGPQPAGSTAGTVNVYGYTQIGIDNLMYRAARLAWFYMTGSLPSGVIDHIDGNRSNDKWSNLRDVTHKMNCENKRQARPGKKSSSFLGITRNGKGWLAQIKADGKLIYLGTYSSEVQAHEVYVTAKRKFHKGCTI